MWCYLIATPEMSHRDSGRNLDYAFAARVQVKSNLIPGSMVRMQIHHSDALRPVTFDRKRAVPMIVRALLGVAILTEVTPVLGMTTWDPSTPSTVPLRADLAMRMGRTDTFSAAPQVSRPPWQNRALSGSGASRVLTGVIAYDDPKQGFAIIGNSLQNTYVARAGQQLPDGSWIREIHRDHVVLEHGGAMETVGMYDGGPSASTRYAQIPASLPPPIPAPIPALPQQARWEEAEMRGITAGETSQARTPDGPPSRTRPKDRDTPRNETAANEARSNEGPPSETPPNNAVPTQVQPEAPLPAAQDPADEFSDDRRHRGQNRGKW